jgi:hypothetical protein
MTRNDLVGSRILPELFRLVLVTSLASTRCRTTGLANIYQSRIASRRALWTSADDKWLIVAAARATKVRFRSLCNSTNEFYIRIAVAKVRIFLNPAKVGNVVPDLLHSLIDRRGQRHAEEVAVGSNVWQIIAL